MLATHNNSFVRTDLAPSYDTCVQHICDRVMGISPFRLLVLLDRSAKNEWTQYVDHWVVQRRGFVLGETSTLDFKNFQQDSISWTHVEGPWEFVLVEGGIASDFATGVNRPKLLESLNNLLGRKKV